MSKNKINVEINNSENVKLGDLTIENNSSLDRDEIRQLFSEIDEIVLNEGSKEAKEVYDKFKTEAEKESPIPSVLRALWIGLESMLPILSQSINIATKIGKFIEGK